MLVTGGSKDERSDTEMGGRGDQRRMGQRSQMGHYGFG